MSSHPTKEFIAQTVQDLIGSQIEFAYLLGSFALGRENNASDIDLAVYWKKEPEFNTYSKWISVFEERLGREVDLVSLNSTDIIFANQVLQKGLAIVVNSPGVFLNWKVQKMGEYPDFKFSRKSIESNLLRKKNV